MEIDRLVIWCNVFEFLWFKDADEVCLFQQQGLTVKKSIKFRRYMAKLLLKTAGGLGGMVSLTGCIKMVLKW